MRRILIATEGSPCSDEAVRHFVLERFLDRTHIWGVMALGAGVLGLVALAGVGAARLLSGS